MGRRPKPELAPLNDGVVGLKEPPPRVLFLHGYTSNGLLFERKLAPLLRALGVDATFVTAPHDAHADWVEEAAAELGERGAARSWFIDVPGATDDGWAASLAHIAAAADGGYDGVFAFSQGCRAALRLCAAPGSLGRALRFAVLCSAPDCAADWPGGTLSLPSMFVVGESDSLVPRAVSERSMRRCAAEPGARAPPPLLFEHAGGHAVPITTEFMRACGAFVREAMAAAPAAERRAAAPRSAAAAAAPPPPRRPPPPAEPAPEPAPEPALIGELEDEALAELDALRAILADELELDGDGDGADGGGALDPARPAALRVLLRADPPADEAAALGAARLGASLYLRLRLPRGYPSRATLAGCASLEVELASGGGGGGSVLPRHFARSLATHCDASARACVGCVAVFELVTAARDWVERACGGARSQRCDDDDDDEAEAADAAEADDDGAGARGASAALGLPSRRRAGADAHALPPALCAALAAAPTDWSSSAAAPDGAQPAAPAAAAASPSRGGRWRFTIGLVGKPSAGKSSFFNAATDTLGAKVGAHPFTTIEPNTGVALVRVRAPAGAPVRSVLVPVVLKDVAGLVPGACDGRGRGNRFLNDLCDADALVHITDASASADAHGNLIVAAHAAVDDDDAAADAARAPAAARDAEPARAEGTSSMRGDVVWVHWELHRWVFDNIAAAWDKVLRKPDHLFRLFTGYQCAPALAEAALHACEPRPPPLDAARAWAADDVAALVDAFLALRFATVICANKADLGAAAAHVDALRAELGARSPALARAVVAASALCEGEVQRLEREGVVARAGAAADEAERAVLHLRAPPTATGCYAPADARALELARGCGYELRAADGEGAREAAAALARLRAPVGPARVPVAGGVQATLQRAFWLRPPVVVFPVAELASARSYALSDAALRESAEPGAEGAHVRDVVLLRPGSTVADLFQILLHAPYKLLGGEFVRAEGRPLDEPRAVRQLRKDEPLAQGCVVKFYSTRKGQRVKQ